MTDRSRELRNHWEAISPLLTVQDDRDYERTVAQLNDLMDEVGDDERHPLYSLLDTLGMVLHAYEAAHQPLRPCSGLEALCFLMDEHGLVASDLAELGSPAEATALLAGDRDLTLAQARALAARFHVTSAVFV